MSQSQGIKVLVVDDSIFHRQLLIGILKKYNAFQVIGEASNGGEAIKEVILKSPDVITLDLEMPGMDGFTFLRWLMFAKPTRTLVVTSKESNRSVFKALELGAVDFMIKPVKRDSGLFPDMENEFMQKLAAAVSVDLGKVTQRLGRRERRLKAPAEAGAWRTAIKGIAIVSSTGGPPAIQMILKALPVDFPVPIYINQHMPAGFTSLFAKRLESLTGLKVKEAEDNEFSSPGVYIAPGGRHLSLAKSGGRLRLIVSPPQPEDRYVPSGDKLLLSVAEVMGPSGVGVILTGMGDDGVIGLAHLRKAGGLVIAESEKSCVIYGMPKAAVDRGLANRILPLEEIPGALIALGQGGLA